LTFVGIALEDLSTRYPKRLSFLDFRLLGAIAFGGAMTFDDVSLDSVFNGDSISIKGGGLVYGIALPSSSGFVNVWP
jgi:hypothetical protein